MRQDTIPGLDDDAVYRAFVEKFKPKKTTDDCLTPPEVYDVVLGWVVERYGIDPAKVVRPFWPGADYAKRDYPEGCIVVDNPPFSILAQICDEYIRRGVRFFLFAPSLMCLSSRANLLKMNHIVCAADIVYANGANVKTAFVTNLDEDGTVLESAPDLGKLINEKCDELRRQTTRELPKYVYPDEVITAAKMQYFASHGTALKINARDCAPISSLEAMGDRGIFGGGLLLSERAAAERAAAERAAAERAAAERAAAHVWELSEAEREMVRMLGRGADE